MVEDNANESANCLPPAARGGLQVDTAGDGADALDYLHSGGKPDVVLLDMGLPRVDGPTTVREIRRDPALAGLRIFGVSGRAGRVRPCPRARRSGPLVPEAGRPDHAAPRSERGAGAVSSAGLTASRRVSQGRRGEAVILVHDCFSAFRG